VEEGIGISSYNGFFLQLSSCIYVFLTSFGMHDTCWVWSLIIFNSTATLDPSSKWGGNVARKIIAAKGVQGGAAATFGSPPLAGGFGGSAPEAKNSCKIAL